MRRKTVVHRTSFTTIPIAIIDIIIVNRKYNTEIPWRLHSGHGVVFSVNLAELKGNSMLVGRID